MQVELPYSEDDFRLLAGVVFSARARILMDPRLTKPHFQELVFASVDNEQKWLNLKLARHHVRQPGILYGVYESSSELQAFAIETRMDPPGFIAVSFHLLLGLTVYFNMVFSHPDLLVDCGDVHLEAWPRAQMTPDVIDLAPKGRERQELSRICLTMAIRFLTAHEMTHILNGHIRYRMGVQASWSMAETSSPVSADGALTAQTLEMDADAGAILECMTDELLIFGPFDATKIEERTDGYRSLYLDPRYLRLWLFAIYSLFRIMHASKKKIERSVSSHPAPMERLAMIVTTLGVSFDQGGHTQAVIDLQDAFSKAMNDGERAVRVLTPAEIPLSLEHLEKLVELGPYIRSLTDKWKDLRPLLEPFHRGSGKLAPVQNES